MNTRGSVSLGSGPIERGRGGLWAHKTLYDKFVRWSRIGVFDRISANPAAEEGPAASLLKGGMSLAASAARKAG